LIDVIVDHVIAAIDVLYLDTTTGTTDNADNTTIYIIMMVAILLISIISILRLDNNNNNNKRNSINNNTRYRGNAKTNDNDNNTRRMKIELEQRKIREYNYQSQISSLKDKLLVFQNMYKINDDNFNKLAEIITHKEEKYQQHQQHQYDQSKGIQISPTLSIERIQQDNDSLRLINSNASIIRLNQDADAASNTDTDTTTVNDHEVKRIKEEHDALRVELKLANDAVRVSNIRIQSYEELLSGKENRDPCSSDIVSLYQKRNEQLEEELETCKMSLFDLENVYNAVTATVSSLKSKIQDQDQERLLLVALAQERASISNSVSIQTSSSPTDGLAKAHQVPRTPEADKLLDETVIRYRALEEYNESVCTELLCIKADFQLLVNKNEVLRNAEARLTVSIDELSRELETCKATNLSLNETTASLTKDLQATKQANTIIEEKLKQLQDASSCKDHIITFLKSSNADMQIKLRTIELVREELSKEKLQHVKLIEEYEEDVSTVANNLKDAESAMASITAEKKVADDEIVMLQNLNMQLSEANKQLSGQCNALKQELDTLQGSVDLNHQTRGVYEEKANECIVLQERYEQMVQDNRRLTDVIVEEQNKVLESAKKLTALQVTIVELRTELNNGEAVKAGLLEDVCTLQTSVDGLSERLALVEQRCADSEAKVDMMSLEKTAACQLIQTLNDEIKAKEQQLQQHQQRHEHDMTAASLLNDKLQRIELQKFSLAMEQNDTVQDLVVLKKELASLTVSEESMKRTREELQHKILSSEASLEQALQETVAVKADLEASLLSHSSICKERDNILAQLAAVKSISDNLIQQSTNGGENRAVYEEQVKDLMSSNARLEARVIAAEREHAIFLNELAKEKENVRITQLLVANAEHKYSESQQIIAGLRSSQAITTQRVVETEKEKAVSQSEIVKLKELLENKNRLVVATEDRLKQLQETIDEMRTSGEASCLKTIVSDLQQTNIKLTSELASMMEEKQSLSCDVVRLTAQTQDQETQLSLLMKRLADTETNEDTIASLMAIKETNESTIASMNEEITSLVSRIATLDSIKVELETEIADIVCEKKALEQKLRATHLEDTTVCSSIFETQDANMNDEDSSLYQGLDYNLMDSMNISCDAHAPVTGSPRGFEYVRVAEETTKYLLNELDDLRRTKETLERSIRDIRIKLTPKKTPNKRLSLSPLNKTCSPIPVKVTTTKAITPHSKNKSPKRAALSPISVNTRNHTTTTGNATNKRIIKRKSISIDVGDDTSDNINDENDNPNRMMNNNNNNNTYNDNNDNNNDNNDDDDNENELSCISVTKVKPTTTTITMKRTSSLALRAAGRSRLKIGKINISSIV